MAENGNIYNNNNLSNFNNIETREFINRGTTTTSSTILTNSTTSSLGTVATTITATTILEQGLSERDATHFRLRNGIIQGFEYITCLSCGEAFKHTSLLDIYDHYRERPHLRHFSNCLYCQGKVHQYYHNREHQFKYYHNCLRWKRGEDH